MAHRPDSYHHLSHETYYFPKKIEIQSESKDLEHILFYELP